MVARLAPSSTRETLAEITLNAFAPKGLSVKILLAEEDSPRQLEYIKSSFSRRLGQKTKKSVITDSLLNRNQGLFLEPFYLLV